MFKKILRVIGIVIALLIVVCGVRAYFMNDQVAIIKAVKDNQNTQLCFLDDIVIDAEIPAHLKHLEDEISKLDVMKMTPIDALLKLNDLKKHLELQ